MLYCFEETNIYLPKADYRQTVWICLIVEVVKQKAWHRTEAPSPQIKFHFLFPSPSGESARKADEAERSPIAIGREVRPPKHNDLRIFYMRDWFDEQETLPSASADGKLFCTLDEYFHYAIVASFLLV